MKNLSKVLKIIGYICVGYGVYTYLEVDWLWKEDIIYTLQKGFYSGLVGIVLLLTSETINLIKK